MKELCAGEHGSTHDASGSWMLGIVKGTRIEPEAVNSPTNEKFLIRSQEAPVLVVMPPLSQGVYLLPLLRDAPNADDLFQKLDVEWYGSMDVGWLAGVVGEDLDDIV